MPPLRTSPLPPPPPAAAAATARPPPRLAQQPQQQPRPPSPPPHERLCEETLSEDVRRAEYAVRGELVSHAQALQAALAARPGSLPFSRVVFCNIGNPQQLGQPPITFFRQVLALCDYPELIADPRSAELFPSDVIERARMFTERIPGGTGAYSESKGAAVCREAVAGFVGRRDGLPCDPEDVFLTDGASPGVHYLMKALLRDSRDCVLTPIPQYPLYSATITLYGGTLLPYYLDEADGWALDTDAMAAAVAGARASGRHVRALVVINPGNPTGQCLGRANMEAVLRLCAAEGIVLMADEVYQDNVYAPGRSFVSFRRVASDCGLLGALPLVSFNSISKGAVGECGRRGGYFQLSGFDPAVRDALLKLASINLCPNLSGQICTALVCDPPAPGQPSHGRYAAERAAILDSLRSRAATLTAALNALEGVTCNAAEGAMYVFPKLTLPPRALAAAAAARRPPDLFYCWRLLEATGVCVVPGSGFGQAEGTWHFRTTFLPPPDQMRDVCAAITAHHTAFMDEFRDP